MVLKQGAEEASRRLSLLMANAPAPDEEHEAFAEMARRIPGEPEEPRLLVSENPGAYEEHVIRRCQNPYFEEDRQKIAPEDLERARELDQREYEKAAKRLAELMEKAKDLPDQATIGHLQPLRQASEDLIEFCMGVGGRAKALATQADRLRDAMIETMRKALINDPKGMAALEEANAYYEEVFRPMHLPIVIQFKKNGAIPSEDLIPAIVSQEAAMIAILCKALPANVTQLIRIEALKLLQAKREKGYRDPEYLRKAGILLDGLQTDNGGEP